MSWGLHHTILIYLGFTHLMRFFQKMPILYSTPAYPGVVEVPAYFLRVLPHMKFSDSVSLLLPRLWRPQKSAFLLLLICPPCSVSNQLFPNHSYEHIIHLRNRNPNSHNNPLESFSLLVADPFFVLIFWIFSMMSPSFEGGAP